MTPGDYEQQFSSADSEAPALASNNKHTGMSNGNSTGRGVHATTIDAMVRYCPRLESGFDMHQLFKW